MPVNWSLFGAPVDVGQQFRDGMQQGQQNALRARQVALQEEQYQTQRGQRNALAKAYDPATGAIDPARARAAYAGAGDIEGAMQFDAQQRQQRQAVSAQQRADAIAAANIIRQVNPTDDASWQQVLGMARQYGIAVPPEVPQTFDPRFVEHFVAGAEALRPQEEYTLGAGDVRYRGNQVIGRGAPQRPRYVPVPPGGRLILDPSYGTPPGTPPPAQSQVVAPPAVGTVEDGHRFRGGDPADPANWEPVQGGASPNGSRTFPAGQ
jgi:hypothetical protein